MKARRALSSASIWRRVGLYARRPDHLVHRYPDGGELVLPPNGPFPAPVKEGILTFFPPVVPMSTTDIANRAELNPIDLKFIVLKKHSFELPFDFLLASMIARGSCAGG